MGIPMKQILRCGHRLHTWSRIHLESDYRPLFWASSQFRCLSETSRPANADWDEEANAELERQSQQQENRYRRLKKVFSTLLFGSTLGMVYLAKRKKQAALSENLRDCVRLPVDDDYQGGHQEFYRVPSPRLGGKPVYVLPGQMVRFGSLRLIKDFQVRPSDVFVASFPKAGTTWVQEIVFLVKHDLDFAKAAEKVLESRFPYLEYLYPGIHSVSKLESPRLIKTHLPFDLLPPNVTANAKVIYVKRNPKDTAVSYFHFAKMLALSNYRGSFEDWLTKFKKDQVPYGPYFYHLESYMEKQDDPNLLILSYEELSRDPAEVIRKIGHFLDRPLQEDEVTKIVHHTSFESMSQNPSVNYSHWDEIGIRNKKEAQFLRKGKVGDWRNYFDEKSNTEFDIWIRERNSAQRQFEYDL